MSLGARIRHLERLQATADGFQDGRQEARQRAAFAAAKERHSTALDSGAEPHEEDAAIVAYLELAHLGAEGALRLMTDEALEALERFLSRKGERDGGG